MENKAISNHFDTSSMKNIQDLSTIQELFDKIEEIYFTNYKTERNELLKTSISSLKKKFLFFISSKAFH